jgi:predicted ABC-type ATPase
VAAEVSPDPVLHVLAGPNGSGKSTYVERVLQPATHLPFINADVIAHRRWPGEESDHAYDASDLAAQERLTHIGARTSFITETVFSHPSKIELIALATRAGYHVTLHVILLPPDTSVARVSERVIRGGHDVPEHKIRERYDRLWDLVVQARRITERTEFLDNSTASSPYRRVAVYENGAPVGDVDWPAWTPAVLR